ncbi:MAG: hypothetical protein AAF360_09020, partial [Pseudomonadota bacterium]
LALNFLLIGLGVGVIARMNDKAPRIGWGGFVSQQIVELAAGPNGEKVRQVMERRRETYRALRGERNDSWREIAVTLSSSPFDPDALKATVSSRILDRNAARVQSYDLMAEAMTMMSDAERAALAARIGAFVELRSKKRR